MNAPLNYETRSHKRGINRAIKAARLSTLKYHRTGAALYFGSRLISVGWNNHKTHPDNHTPCSQHAEFNVFIGVNREDFSKARIYVARITRGGQIGIAKPCGDCRDFLTILGINNIYYTDRHGLIKKL